MNWRAKITVAAGVVLLAGCRELPRYFASDTTIARAGGKELRMRDVRSVVPKGLSGDDSAAFMKLYVDRWIVKQLKLKEAETLFSSSAGDIDKMVEEYRQALLIKQLDQHYVDRSPKRRSRPTTTPTRAISNSTGRSSRGVSCSLRPATARLPSSRC